MPPAAGTFTDRFANLAIVTVTESAANTLTWKKLEMGTSLFEKVAVVIHRVEWSLATGGSGWPLFAGTGDTLQYGIANSNTLATLDADQEGLMIRGKITMTYFGAAANGIFTFEPMVHDFTNLPGGGVIMLPQPFYVGIKGTSVANPFIVTARVLFTFMELKGEDFLELLQARQTLIST